MKPVTLQTRFTLMSYAVIGTLLLLALWNPSIVPAKTPVDLLLLLDESASVDPLFNDEQWRSFLLQSQSAGKDSRISLVRFADRARVEIPWLETANNRFEKLALGSQPPRHQLLDRGSTSIAPAVLFAIEHSDSARHTAIILSSDGIDNIQPSQGTFPLTALKPNQSLYYLNPEVTQSGAQFIIESINLPAYSDPQQALPFSLSIDSPAGGQGRVEILNNDTLVFQQEVTMQAGQRRVLRGKLPASPSNRPVLQFLIRDDQGNIIEQQHRLVTIRHERQLLYIDNDSADSLIPFLQGYGWNITQLNPHDLPVDENFFDRFNLVMINDIRADSIHEAITRNLGRSIRQAGTGLIVLGGAHSFGSGGYRFSTLEDLLPVTSESSRPIPSAAFVFLLDKSGSMETTNLHSSRLSDALKAISESAKSLRINDESALLTFDRDVNVLLPLKHHRDISATLDKPWKIQPSGGTRLAPALVQAIKLLSTSDSKQRYIILVTDGFVDSENISSLKQALRTSGIKLIALVTGQDAELSALTQLTAVNGGKVLKIHDSAQLPHFMRQQLETQLNSWFNSEVTPHSVLPAPFIKPVDHHWKSIPGYQVTREKPSASMYVSAKQADPLLAIHQFGAGKVAALPGGMLTTLTTTDMPGGMLAWMDSQQINPYLDVSHHYQSANIQIEVDTLDSHNAWHSATTAELKLTYPDGSTRQQTMQAIAPGRYRAVLPATATGVYSARIRVDNEQTLYSAYVSSDLERRYQHTVPWLQQAISNGQIQLWTETVKNEFMNKSETQVATRPLWLVLAFIVYLLLIFVERNPGLKELKLSLNKLKLAGNHENK